MTHSRRNVESFSKPRLIVGSDCLLYVVSVTTKRSNNPEQVKLRVSRFVMAALKKAAEDEGFTLEAALDQYIRESVGAGYLDSSPPSAEHTPLFLDHRQIDGVVSDLRARRPRGAYMLTRDLKQSFAKEGESK